jgi:hypothetical protein
MFGNISFTCRLFYPNRDDSLLVWLWVCVIFVFIWFFRKKKKSFSFLLNCKVSSFFHSLGVSLSAVAGLGSRRRFSEELHGR